MSKNKHKNYHNQVKSCALYVDGMHCSSCEILIEKKLLKDKQIESADASLNDAEVQITYKGSEKPVLDSINQSLKGLGYRLSYGKIGKKQLPLISFNSKGELILNSNKWNNLLKAILMSIGLIVVFFFVEGLNLGNKITVNKDSALPLFLAYGFVAGLSSCAALVGGLLLSLIKQWNETYIDSDRQLQKAQPHILFHIGRLVSFLLFGALLGAIGDTIGSALDSLPISDNLLYALVVFLISGTMLLLALQMLGVGWAQGFRPKAPKFFLRFATDETNFEGKYMPFVTGFLTFFLPCGFTLIVQGLAIATGDPLKSALMLFLFALGTFIPLAGISLGGVKFNSRPNLTAKFNLIAGLIIIFFVLYNVNGQLNALGLPSLSDIRFSSEEEAAGAQIVQVDENGVQVVNLIAKGFEYKFDTNNGPSRVVTIKAGIPTKLIVDNQGIQGCGSFLAANGLIKGFKPLQKGENIIDIGTPDKNEKGYKITCSMGMVPPVTLKAI